MIFSVKEGLSVRKLSIQKRDMFMILSKLALLFPR